MTQRRLQNIGKIGCKDTQKTYTQQNRPARKELKVDGRKRGNDTIEPKEISR